ncbi:hypothetical protein MTO96_045065 [Rhipicephalus appendiculatus]
MGCFLSCCSTEDNDDEYRPLSGSSESYSGGHVIVVRPAADIRDNPAGGLPRRTARRRSKTFPQGSAATDHRVKKKVRHFSFGSSRSARRLRSRSATPPDDVTVGCSTDAMLEEDTLREFFGPSEDV